MKLPRLIITGLLALASITQVHAANLYMTVSGAGSKNGTSWANAYDSATIGTVVNTTMQNGDILYLSGPETAGAPTYGDLRFTITSSGTSGARKSLIGVDRGFGLPSFVGTQGTRSYTTITLGSGVSYWTIKDLKIERREMGIASSSGNARVGLIIDGVTVKDTSSKCFSFTNCDDILVENCRAERYSKIGFMFNHSCDGVTVRNSVADCTGTGDVPDPSWKSSASSPVGFNFHTKGSSLPSNTDILLEDCEALNNDEDTAAVGDFEQGDGFKMEGKNDDITLRRCISHHNQDAGYDLKGTNQVLDDCLALHNLRHGFKLWYNGTLTNCISAGNLSRQLTLPSTTSGNTFTINASTLHCGTNSQSGAVIETSGNTVILNDTIISFAGTAGSYTAGPGTFTLNGTVKRANTSNTSNAPKYVNPTLPWDGEGTNFDNLTYGLTKGYNSQSAGSIAVVIDNADTAGVTVTGSWTTSTSSSGYFDTNYMHDGNSGKGSKSVRFTPTIPETGSYEVFAWWIASSNRASNVPIDIVHASGTTTVQVDQRSNGSQFVSLGTYTFNSGTSGSALIRNTGTNGYVMVDAVAFVKPQAVAEIIMDSTDSSGIIQTGSWTSSTYTSGYIGADYLHDGNTGKGSKSIRYTPTITTSGNYEVFARWTTGSNRASNTPIDITYSGGTDLVQVNQRFNGGQWVSLGTYHFNAGTSGNVLISTTGTNGYVIADGIRFAPN